MAVPEVDAIEGLPPAVAQQQRGTPTTRSSVGGQRYHALQPGAYAVLAGGPVTGGAGHLYAEVFSPNTSVGACPTAPLKCVVGIANANDTFVACFGRSEASQQLRFGQEATLANTLAGFTALLACSARQQAAAAPLWVVVEATGVYDEALAYLLADTAQALSVLLPNKVKYVAHSTERKSKTEPERARQLAHLTHVPDIGLTTALVVVAATNGFLRVENERQRACSAGLDVVQRQSGLAAPATRISRRGNGRRRTALYLPAGSSRRYPPSAKAFYARWRARQPSGKPGVLAVLRQLLLLCYSLWKNDRPYDPQDQPARVAEKEVALAT
jgi:transposase